MKIVALGTGTSQGIPIIGCQCQVCQSSDIADTRLRSSIYVESAAAKILIDIGPDFRTQFLDNQLTTTDIVLITHEHNDHIIGLDDIRAINYTQNKSIPIYASPKVSELIKKRFAYAFSETQYPGLPQISLEPLPEISFTYKDIDITPIKILHGSLPIWGFRLNDLVYITDGSQILESEYEKLSGTKVLIINALRDSSHHSHFSLTEALAIIKRINPEKAYITHISHSMGLTARWAKNLPTNVSPLQDRMVIEI